MAGFFCGIIRFGLEFSYTVPPCGSGLPDPRPEFVRQVVGKLHYLHFGVLVFCLTGIMTVIISFLTEPIPEDRVSRRYVNSPTDNSSPIARSVRLG